MAARELRRRPAVSIGGGRHARVPTTGVRSEYTDTPRETVVGARSDAQYATVFITETAAPPTVWQVNLSISWYKYA